MLGKSHCIPDALFVKHLDTQAIMSQQKYLNDNEAET